VNNSFQICEKMDVVWRKGFGRNFILSGKIYVAITPDVMEHTHEIKIKIYEPVSDFTEVSERVTFSRLLVYAKLHVFIHFVFPCLLP